MRIPRPAPRPEWYPQTKDGPIAPLWWYLAQRWPWLAWWTFCVAVAVAELAWNTPEGFNVLTNSVIWFTVGIQMRGIYDEHQTRKAKTAALNARLALLGIRPPR